MFEIGGLFRVLYTCPMCRKDFDSHEGANECIRLHITPVTILTFNGVGVDGPRILEILLSNGEIVTYTIVKKT